MTTFSFTAFDSDYNSVPEWFKAERYEYCENPLIERKHFFMNWFHSLYKKASL